MKKIVCREKETKCGKIGKKKIKTVVNREILRQRENERFKKKRINLCGFFKDKLPGKNLL